MPDGDLGLVVGDVSGHGVGSALLMATTRAYLRVLAKVRSNLGEILSQANSMLADDIREDHFVTLLLARLDPRTKTLSYANAGHPQGYVISVSGELKANLESTALPLGVLPETSFPEGDAIALASGDVIVLFTDGVTEARSTDDQLFGSERALRVIRSHQDRTAREIAEQLYQTVREHASPGELVDDVAVTIMKVA